jgi:proline iminopeptidase
MFVTMSDGARLFVERIGDAPGKPLVIVHHGAPGVTSHAESLASFGFLADRFRVLAFDARGSGLSDGDPPLTHARWVADLEELRRWAAGGTFILAGESYGGFIALEYALEYPERVAALILRDTAAEGFSLKARAIERALASDRVTVGRDQLERVFGGAIADENDMLACIRAILPLYAGDANVGAPALSVAPAVRVATHNAAFADCLPKYDVIDRLGEIRAPTLVTVGRHDWITPVACSERIAAGIPHAELAVFEHSGHSPPADEPALFQATVRDFLRRAGLPAGPVRASV